MRSRFFRGIKENFLRAHFGEIGGKIYRKPIFRCGNGADTRVGDNFYANYGCIMLGACLAPSGEFPFVTSPVLHLYGGLSHTGAGWQRSGESHQTFP